MVRAPCRYRFYRRSGRALQPGSELKIVNTIRANDNGERGPRFGFRFSGPSGASPHGGVKLIMRARHRPNTEDLRRDTNRMTTSGRGLNASYAKKR